MEGIDNSKVFIAFVNMSYLKKSKIQRNNAGREFRYACSQHIEEIILVVIDQKATNKAAWRGSLVEFYLNDALFIDMSTTELQLKNFDSLVQRLKEFS